LPGVLHVDVGINIVNIFKNYLRKKPCKVYNDSVDVYFSEKDRVIPDVSVVCDKNIIKKNGIYGAPDLIAEILSPGTAKNDKGYKKDIYEKYGVKEYWIVDPANFEIDVYLLKDGKYRLDRAYIIFPDYLLEKMTEEQKSKLQYKFKTSLFDDLIIDIEEVFEDVIF